MFVIGLFLLLLLSSVHADNVIPDNTLGTSVELNYNTEMNISEYLVSDGRYIGNENEGNLFHSFERFSLENSENAIFIDEGLLVDNIITRVTGKEISNIDGKIYSEIAKANLYFLNPNGIIFGENASLDIDGSVYISTASSLTLDDNIVFNTKDFVQDDLLSIASPYIFGFLANPATISANNVYLQTASDTELALIGGDINIESSSLESFSGTINLVSVGSEGGVVLEKETGTYTNVDSFKQLGNIKLRDYELSPILDNEGNIATNEETDEELSEGLGSVLDVSGDVGGNIFIRAENFIMTDYAGIYADIGNKSRDHSDAPDKASIIDINVKETIAIENKSAIEASNFDNSIKGINISINAKELKITSSEDTSLVNKDSHITILESSNSLEAQAGAINISVNTLDIKNKGFIAAYTDGQGNYAGNIIIKAAKNILIEGTNNSGISYISTSVGFNYNDVKEYIDKENNILVENKGGVLEKSGLGYAGEINIETPILSLSNNAIITSSADYRTQGDAGNITIKSDILKLTNQSGIYAFNDGFGDAGSIDINSNQLEILNSDMYIYSEEGIGGDINIAGGGYTYLENSYILLDSYGNEEIDSAGNVIFSPDILVLNRSHVYGRAFIGNGGSVNISNYFFRPYNIAFQALENNDTELLEIPPQFTDSLIDTSSTFGNSGKITINGFKEDFSELTVSLPKDYESIKLTTNKCLPPKDTGQLIIFERDLSDS